MEEKLFIAINKFLTRETISYLIFGILTTLVDILFFCISNELLGIEYVLSVVIAWIVAVLFAYITNKIWVFNSKGAKIEQILKEVSTFFFARLVSLGFTIVSMIFCVEIIKLDEFISKLLVNILVVIMNYFFSKFFIFKNR